MVNEYVWTHDNSKKEHTYKATSHRAVAEHAAGQGFGVVWVWLAGCRRAKRLYHRLKGRLVQRPTLKVYSVRVAGEDDEQEYGTTAPSLAAVGYQEHLARCGRFSLPAQIWVRLQSPGSKWTLYRVVDGKAKRAKSLEVPHE